MSDAPNFFYLIIKYNKWRFVVLAVGVVVIIAALICAMVYDPMPLWGTIVASAIMAGVVATTIWHWIKYRKWEKQNEDNPQ